MQVSLPSRSGRSRVVALGLPVGIAFAAAVAGWFGERLVSPQAGAPSVVTLPGMTVADDVANAQMPVVTSLRSDGEAQRLGVRVGDRIDAIDDRPVRDIAGVDRAIRERDAHRPVALHIRRGDAVWTVAIDRPEAITRATEPHDPQDPAG